MFGLSFLYSEAGGTEQQQHLDFVQNESSVTNQKQNLWRYSFLLSLQERTKLVGDDGNPIYLKPGQFIIFREDYNHSGASYEEDNVRIFGKLVFEGARDADEDNIFFQKNDKVICPVCMNAFLNPNSYYVHKNRMHNV